MAQTLLDDRLQLNPAIDYVSAHPSIFGGVYVDEAAKGALNIASIGDDPLARTALNDLLPPGYPVEWRTVARTTSELDKVRDELISSIPELQASGSTVSSVAIDVRNNMVGLTIAGPLNDVTDSLMTSYGSALEIKTGPMLVGASCSSRSSCTPWRGGIEILPGDGGGLQCTYGFNVRSTSSNTVYMMTAGHCDNEDWQHDGYSIGTTNLNNLLTSGHTLGDFQRVPTFLASPENLVYYSSTDPSRSITADRTYAHQIVGDYVCASGYTDGNRCGYITNSDFYYGIIFRGSAVYMWGKLAGFRSDPGDSGGPVLINNTALGITSARDGNTATAYSTVDNGMTALAIRLCLTPLCS